MKRHQNKRPFQRRSFRGERLEERILLTAEHVFANFQGEITSDVRVVEVPIQIDSADFTLQQSKVLLGFRLRAPAVNVSFAKWKSEFGQTPPIAGAGADLDGSGVVDAADYTMLHRAAGALGGTAPLDPAAVVVRNSISGEVVPSAFAAEDIYGSVDSLAIAELGAGQFTLEVSAQYETTGEFELEVFLVGDANGNGMVDTNDHGVIADAYGSKHPSDEYVLEADANLDGRITSFDRQMWQRGRGDATSITPLFVSLNSVATVVDVPQFDLSGTTIPGLTVELDADNDGEFDDGSVVADDQGSFGFDVLLVEGANTLSVRANDSFGQHRASSVGVFYTTATFLTEGDRFITTLSELIDLGVTEGSRTLTIHIDSHFDTTDVDVLIGDLFQIYLVDPMSPGTTLLDRGNEGEALFSLSETGADYLPGLVTYNGTKVAIDLTSLADESEGLLVFQLINGDSDDGTSIIVEDITNQTIQDGVASPVWFNDTIFAEPGTAIDLSTYTIVNDGSIETLIRNVRVDGETGSYLADLTLRNTGNPVSRALAVRLNNLPDGIVLSNASSLDGSGAPYVNLMPAIMSGGLGMGATTMPVTLRIANPELLRFELDIDILSAGLNRVPIFRPIDDITIMPGDVATVVLQASDPDGDRVTYSLLPTPGLPSAHLSGNTLVFTPTPAQLGVFSIGIRASDGALSADQMFTLTVAPDPITTTRLSGRILDNDGVTPLVGVPVEVNGITALTNIDGFFTLEVDKLSGDDAVKVRANEANIPGKVYPFVAEKIHLVLANGPFAGINNIITRPIYLPVLDVAGGTTVDPAADTLVEQEIALGEMAAVFVQMGSLLMDDGAGGMVPFDGVLSITEVPGELTPAALPPNLLPDIVVTIQPGEMIFTDPAELTLPNRAGYEPGTLMDLWSINPVTGVFDNVGVGQVSSDGSQIETIEGGVLNSSWHFFAPDPGDTTDPNDDERSEDDKCDECKAATPDGSAVELHSGHYQEWHDLVSYQSLGQTWQLRLFYDSQTADPSPIIPLSIDNALAGENRRLAAALSFTGIAGTVEVRGSDILTSDGRSLHFLNIPVGGGSIAAALQGDLSSQPTGRYTYDVLFGNVLFDDEAGAIAGALDGYTGDILHINAIDSPFGAGWNLVGLETTVENADGSVMLVDGDGSVRLYVAPAVAGEAYDSPPGDFSTLVKNADNTFTRTTTDQTVYEHDTAGRLVSMTDRNGNEMQYVYESDVLTKIIDPVGLETIFGYNVDGRVSTITDPAGRVTMLDYDSAGNLTRITDPDTSSRSFDYDADHHLVAENDQLGRREEMLYGFHGRVVGSIHKDGTTATFDPLQARFLYPMERTSDPLSAPVARLAPTEITAQTADANGNVTTI